MNKKKNPKQFISSVALYPIHREWVENNAVNLSRFVRKTIDEKIREKVNRK